MKHFNPSETDFADPARWCQALQEAAADFQVSLSAHQLNRFLVYYRELKFWNSRVNLIASAESARDIFVKHFLDSLTLIPFLPVTDGKLIDIGTGGGFPGIPLKIALENLNVTLVEASRKKVSFLKSLRRLLRLTDVQILQERVECLIGDESFRNRFDIVVSRAALKLPDYLRFGQELVSSRGVIIAMKGANYRAELKDVRGYLENHGLFLSEVRSLTLPGTGDFRAILIFGTTPPPSFLSRESME